MPLAASWGKDTAYRVSLRVEGADGRNIKP
jgi:hypothetical protein